MAWYWMLALWAGITWVGPFLLYTVWTMIFGEGWGGL